ncbi:MAG TPA: glycosyltransferase family 39 protein, partial [Thermomicrobiales bacterium]|nr:glycosyltransferase family 39 protein [Thermomicrobiales bacterium]
LALYAGAAAVLLAGIGEHPPFPYNWEAYTGWRLFDDWLRSPADFARIFGQADGLMTESGQGPLVGAPARLGFALAGVGLLAMRVPTALVAAAAVPLLWLVARRLASAPAALLAALLLAISPVFLFYSRTATLVGISLVPELLAALGLLGTLATRDGGAGWRWLLALQAALIAGEYSYAPTRLLWPLALGALAAAALVDRAGRRWRVRALALTALSLPAALLFIGWLTGTAHGASAVVDYFEARGEQIIAMRNPADYDYYLRPAPGDAADGALAGSTGELAWRLVRQNASDLVKLFLDRDTQPVLTDYWSASGRLWPALLAPWFALGLMRTVVDALRRPAAWLLLALAGGLTLPLLLTSRVHIGRLVPALPFLLLLAAVGLVWTTAQLRAGLTRLAAGDGGRLLPYAAFALPIGALVWLALATRAEFAVPIPVNRETRTAAALRAAAPLAAERGEAALVDDPALGAEIEQVHAAVYRLQLDGVYRFVGLAAAADPAPGDSRPPLLYGGVLTAVRDGTMRDPCAPLYLVVPEVEPALRAALDSVGCAKPPPIQVLPSG